MPPLTPAEFRNLTWLDIQARLHGLRQILYDGLLRHGPLTTRALAGAVELDLLTVRPRITELCQLGLVEAIDRAGHEGVYSAIPLAVAQARHAEATPEQTLMRLCP